MADIFTRNLFAWLNQVHADHALPHSAFKLAYAISQHINRQQGKAWPSQPTLAGMSGMDVRSVRRLTDVLTEAGHLEVESRRGRHMTSIYRLKYRTLVSAFDDELPDTGVRFTEEKPDNFDKKTGHQCPTNHLKNQMERVVAPPSRAPDGARSDFQQLWEAWRRPYADDEEKAWHAFEQACGIAALTEIMTGAQTWLVVTEARYLPALAKWLGSKGWETKPRERSASRSRGKQSLAEIALRHGGVI